MRQEVDVQWWNDPEVNHLTDSFWVKEAMQSAVGLFWYNHVRKDRLPMPKNLSITLDTERGVVVASGESEVEHTLINNGTKNEQGQIEPRPVCSCGEVMPVGIKTSPQGWHYMHVQRLDTP